MQDQLSQSLVLARGASPIKRDSIDFHPTRNNTNGSSHKSLSAAISTHQ